MHSTFPLIWSRDYRVLNPAGAVTVPADYIGMHFNRWPTANGTGTDDPAPTYGFGSFRTWDANIAFHWSTIQPTQGGAFDWSKPDAYLAPHIAAGRTIVWCFGHVPNWAAQVANQGRLDPYGFPGGSSPPANWADYEAFIAAVANKYKNTVAKLIFEGGNEPGYSNVTNSFWWGTAAELVELNERGRNVVKAIDSRIEWWSPSFTGGILGTNVQGFLNAQSAQTGSFGRDVIDGLALHPYNIQSTYGGDVPGDEAKTDVARQLLLAIGKPNLLLGYHEVGLASQAGTQTLIDWAALSPVQRRVNFARRLAVPAARGVRRFNVYSHGTLLVGDLRTDVDGVCAGINDVHTRVAGKTIAAGQGRLYPDGRIVLPMTDGTVFEV